MAIGVAERRTLKGYEDKIRDLKVQADLVTDALAQAIERRDAADHARKVSEQEKIRLENVVAEKLAEVGKLEVQIDGKRMDLKTATEAGTAKTRALGLEIAELEAQANKLGKEAQDAENRAKKHGPKAKEYTRMTAECLKLEKSIEKSKTTLSELKVKTDRMISDAKDAMQEVRKGADANDDKFRNLQKYETRLNFYADRLRGWYQRKGLRLPVEYKPEKINK